VLHGNAKQVAVREDGVLRMQGRICVPNVDGLRELILEEARSSRYYIHQGAAKMYQDLWQHYWLRRMKKDIVAYVARCLNCQQVKYKHQRPGGLLHKLEIPEWKWERITMDFVVGLPQTQRKFDAVWVIVDRLTKSAYFIPVAVIYSLERLAEIYIREIVRLHGVPVSIILDRGTQFTAVQCVLGTRVELSIAFHPQIDRQSERTIQILEDLLRTYVIDFGGFWDQFLLLAEFAYNNSYQSIIQMAPYEALYGRQCRSPVGWFELGEAQLLGTDLVQDALDKVKVIQDRLGTAQSRQKSYVEHKICDIAFMVGERILLRVSPMKGVMRFEKKGKLSPRYIGLFEILERVGEVAYKVALPPSLSTVHPVFHVSMLRKYYGNPSHMLDFSLVKLDKDLTNEEEPVAILARKVRQLRSKSYPSVRVQWRGRPVEASTWESDSDMRSKYPHLFTSSGTFSNSVRGRTFVLEVENVMTQKVIFKFDD